MHQGSVGVLSSKITVTIWGFPYGGTPNSRWMVFFDGNIPSKWMMTGETTMTCEMTRGYNLGTGRLVTSRKPRFRRVFVAAVFSTAVNVVTHPLQEFVILGYSGTLSSAEISEIWSRSVCSAVRGCLQVPMMRSVRTMRRRAARPISSPVG